MIELQLEMSCGGRTRMQRDEESDDDEPNPYLKKQEAEDSQRLERINWIRSVAEDASLGESVREFAANMLTEIDNDAPVAPAYKRVKAAVELAHAVGREVATQQQARSLLGLASPE